MQLLFQTVHSPGYIWLRASQCPGSLRETAIFGNIIKNFIVFKINVHGRTSDISKNNISRKAYAIIIALYNDYFLSENKKVTLKALLKQNDRIRESNKQQEYNLKNVIKKDNTKIDNIQENTSENMELIKVEEKNIFAKIMNKVKSMLNQLKKRLMKMVNDNFDRYCFT